MWLKLLVITVIFTVALYAREGFAVKPYMWIYWDNVDNKPTPIHIRMCLATIYKNCHQDFNIVMLNNSNIRQYLPELSKWNISPELSLAHKVDIYRILLLHKYGGLYIDADVMVLRRLTDVVKRLKTYDFVGFGCSGTCRDGNGYGRPSNWLLGSRRGGRLISVCKRLMHDKINRQRKRRVNNYHEIGKFLIWRAIRILRQHGYSYYHYNSRVDGTRDRRGKWLECATAFSDVPVDYVDRGRHLMFYVAGYNSSAEKYVNKLTSDQLLNKTNFGKFYRQAMAK